MTVKSSLYDAVRLREVSKRPPRKKTFAQEGSGHPLRRRGFTFVTHEVEERRPFGLSGMNSLLERAGLRRREVVD